MALKTRVIFYFLVVHTRFIEAALVTFVNEILYKFRLTQLVNQSQLYLYGDPSLNDSDKKLLFCQQ